MTPFDELTLDPHRAGSLDRDDDHETFTTWYTATWPKLLGFCAAQAGDWSDGQDAAAAAMLKAVERWGNSDIDSMTAWTFSVALNGLRRTRRRMALEQRLLRQFHSRQGSSELRWRDPDLLAALERLPSRQRAAIAMRYIGDLTQAEVAHAMGIAPGTAAALLNQARSSLRSRLTEETIND